MFTNNVLHNHATMSKIPFFFCCAFTTFPLLEIVIYFYRIYIFIVYNHYRLKSGCHVSKIYLPMGVINNDILLYIHTLGCPLLLVNVRNVNMLSSSSTRISILKKIAINSFNKNYFNWARCTTAVSCQVLLCIQNTDTLHHT